VSRWAIVALLSVIATCLLLEVGALTSSARAQAGQAAGGGGSVFAVAGKVTPETYGLYLVDTRRGTICVYQYLPATHKMKLMSARTYVFDMQLDEYNCDKPTPHDVKKLVEQQRPLRDASSGR